jgi:Spy/CpxP family protein refolding chaperone
VLVEVAGNAVSELALMRAESMSKVRELLTPEQRAKLGKLLTSTTASPRQ